MYIYTCIYTHIHTAYLIPKNHIYIYIYIYIDSFGLVMGECQGINSGRRNLALFGREHVENTSARRPFGLRRLLTQGTRRQWGPCRCSPRPLFVLETQPLDCGARSSVRLAVGARTDAMVA